MKRRLIALVLAALLVLTLMPQASARASRIEQAFSYLASIARTGKYEDGLNCYMLSYDLQPNVKFQLSYNTSGDSIGISLSKGDALESNAILSTLTLVDRYWTYEDNWVDLERFVSGYYMRNDMMPGFLLDYKVLPKNFTGTSGLIHHLSEENRVKNRPLLEDAHLGVNDILTLVDGLLKKGGFSVQDLGFTGYRGHSIHRFWPEPQTLAPTCETEGYEKGVCYVCQKEIVKTLPALGHAWQVKEILSPGEDGAHGQAAYRCSRCGSEKTAPLCAGEVFSDMPAESVWSHAPIDWAFVNGVTNGVDETHFGPERTCTRAQVVTFLWRAAGEPVSTFDGYDFLDVGTDAYYYRAVQWAVEQGITKGTSAERFSPDATCTRAQIVTFLWRAAGAPERSEGENPFRDVAEGQYYADAVLWAVENKITDGVGEDRFAPEGMCTRAQVVTFLYRKMAQSSAG